jgi:YidC/Oxa1 family membrane protein insertase
VFDLISQSMLFLLESLKHIVGNYGWAIIVLTLLVRFALWPVSRSQMRSMKMMQDLQPKMKMLQERYKTDPQRLQMEMMKLYKEYKFNPLGGCLPMLVQLPIFIGLYWAISNPHFMAGDDPTFLNMIHLKHTGVVSHAGKSFDGQMSLSSESGGFLGMGKDHIIASPDMTVSLLNGTTVEKKIPNANKALDITPKELQAGIPIQITSSYNQLGLQDYAGFVKTIQLNVVNTSTKEMEQVTFSPTDKTMPLQTSLPSIPGKTEPHFDVLFLVVIFALTMIGSQKLMTTQTAPTGNEQQKMMMKFMPIMFSGFMFIFPIPAGVLLYMVTNSLFQIFQSWIFQRSSNADAGSPPSQTILDIKPDTPQA